MKYSPAILLYLVLLPIFFMGLAPKACAESMEQEGNGRSFPPLPPPMRPPFQITGHVLDTSSNPIAHVAVTATLVGTSSFVTNDTDINGYFVLSVLTGQWDVSVECMGTGNSLQSLGYECVNDEFITISSANGVVNFVAPAFGTAELSGTVSNTDGTSIVGVRVIALEQGMSSTNARTAQTDVNGFYELLLPAGHWTVMPDALQLEGLGYSSFNAYAPITIGSNTNQLNVSDINFTVAFAPPGMPFFTGQTPVGNYVYYLQPSSNNFFGSYSVLYFPYVYHFDLGWEYFIDAQNPAHGAYIYDFTSGHFWYSEPGIFPFLYDFTFDSWLYCFPNDSASGTYLKNPRVFYNFGTSNYWYN